MNTQDLIRAIHRLKVETGSLACFGCGYEHSCSVRGCAILRSAAATLEKMCHPLDAAAPAAERRMIMDKVKNYPPYLDYPKPYKPITNADRIRAMSDEELAKMLYNLSEMLWCRELPECIDIAINEAEIQEEKCIGCALAWLHRPAE